MKRIKILACAGVAALTPAAIFAHESADGEPPANKPEVQLIHAGTLLAVPGKAPLSQQTVVVSEGRIQAVRSGFVSADDFGSDAKVIDLKDKFVLPGLMDMHVHLSFEFGKDSFALGGAEDPHISGGKAQRDDVSGVVEATANALKTIQAGYTTVRNVGSYGWHVAAVKKAVDEGRIDGPRILTAMHTIYPGSDSGSGACSGPESCRKAARRQIDMGADVIKIYASCSGSKPCGRQHAPGTFLPDEIEAIVETARSRQLTVAAHSHSADGIMMSLRAGVDSIEHGSYTPREAYALFKKKGAYLVPTHSVVEMNVKRDLKDAKSPMREVMQNFVDSHGKSFMGAYRAGVKIAAGSDAGVTPHGENAKELAFYVEEGMPAADAIKAATVHGAALIRRSNDLGTIEAGKIADIIAVDESPLDDIAALQNVTFVMKDGKKIALPARERN